MKRELRLACSERGAEMGRRDNIPNPDEAVKLHLVKLEWYDGDYDKKGAYWGHTAGTNIYWAYGDSADSSPINVFARAKNRNEAKEMVNERMPKAKFYR